MNERVQCHKRDGMRLQKTEQSLPGDSRPKNSKTWTWQRLQTRRPERGRRVRPRKPREVGFDCSHRPGLGKQRPSGRTLGIIDRRRSRKARGRWTEGRGGQGNQRGVHVCLPESDKSGQSLERHRTIRRDKATDMGPRQRRPQIPSVHILVPARQQSGNGDEGHRRPGGPLYPTLPTSVSSLPFPTFGESILKSHLPVRSPTAKEPPMASPRAHTLVLWSGRWPNFFPARRGLGALDGVRAPPGGQSWNARQRHTLHAGVGGGPASSPFATEKLHDLRRAAEAGEAQRLILNTVPLSIRRLAWRLSEYSGNPGCRSKWAGGGRKVESCESFLSHPERCRP